MKKLYSLLRQRPTLLTKLTLSDYLLILEASLTLAVIRIGVLAISFRRIAGMLGTIEQKATSTGGRQLDDGERMRAKRVAYVVKMLSAMVPWRSKCLEEALSTMILLRRRGILSTIYFGVLQENKELQAHAWLCCGQDILTGAGGHNRYAVLFTVGSSLV